MWLASEMAAFAHVSDLGSFTAAARALGVPKVAVSRAIASLERRLGCRLLIRTTRRVALSPAGVLLQPHCERVLREAQAVRTRFARPAAGKRRLRIRVDAGYGRLLVTTLVPRFLERFADLELQIGLHEDGPEPVVGEWDVLIRADDQRGGPTPAGFAITALASLPQLLWATPAYLQRHGHPRQAADLGRHAVLQGPQAPDAGPWLRLHQAGDTQSVPVHSALRVSDPALVHSCTAAGLGIGVLPGFLCRAGEARGRLERVLAHWSVEPVLQLRACHAVEGEAAATTRQFLEFLLANLVPALGTAD